MMQNEEYSPSLDDRVPRRRRLPSVASVHEWRKSLGSLEQKASSTLSSLSSSIHDARVTFENRLKERRRRALWKDTHHSLRSSLIERPEDTDCSGDEVMDEGYASTDPRTLPIRSPYPRMLSQLLPKPPALPTKITFPRAKSRSASNNQLEHDEQDNQETHDWDNESAIQSYPLGSYGVMGEKPQSRQSVYLL